MTLELSEFLNFALEGAKRLIKNGYQFTISDLMHEAKEQFLGCVHPLSYFKAHYLSKNPTRKVESNLLFQTFQKMLKEKNWSARQYGTLRSFNKGLIELLKQKALLFPLKKSNGKTYLSELSQISQYKNCKTLIRESEKNWMEQENFQFLVLELMKAENGIFLLT